MCALEVLVVKAFLGRVAYDDRTIEHEHEEELQAEHIGHALRQHYCEYNSVCRTKVLLLIAYISTKSPGITVKLPQLQQSSPVKQLL